MNALRSMDNDEKMVCHCDDTNAIITSPLHSEEREARRENPAEIVYECNSVSEGLRSDCNAKRMTVPSENNSKIENVIDKSTRKRKIAFTLSCKTFRSNRLTAMLRSRLSMFSLTKFRNFVAHSYGFTLAEVLIILSILGVVAAITITSIVHNYQEKATVVKVKRVYAQLQNAYDLAVVYYGKPLSWLNLTCKDIPEMPFLDYNTNSNKCQYYNDNISDIVFPLVHSLFLPISEPKCVGGYSGFINPPKDKCYINANESVKYPNGKTPANNRPYENQLTGRGRILIKDGTFVTYTHTYKACSDSTGCALISVDINGKKGANTWGKDIFNFKLTQNGILPADNTYSCNMSGISCTKWIIQKWNMDYLRKNISW